MSLNKEIWIKDVQELLYPNNSIIKRATDMTQYLKYHTVHVPQAGANSSVTMNRNLNGSLANTYQRTDSDYTFAINNFTTQPVIVSELETFQTSYDKRASILYNSMKQLETVQTNNFLYAIAPNTGNTLTTGSYSGNSLPFNASGLTATGLRRQMNLADVSTLKAQLDRQNIEQEGRVLIAPSDIYNNDLLQIPTLLNAFQYGTTSLSQAVAPTGYVAKVAGFDIYQRPETVIYMSGAGGTYTLHSDLDGSQEPITVNSTDSWGVIGFHPQYVGYAKGEIEVFYIEGFPGAYGSMLSFLVWGGGANLRQDGKGVAVLIQSN